MELTMYYRFITSYETKSKYQRQEVIIRDVKQPSNLSSYLFSLQACFPETGGLFRGSRSEPGAGDPPSIGAGGTSAETLEDSRIKA